MGIESQWMQSREWRRRRRKRTFSNGPWTHCDYFYDSFFRPLSIVHRIVLCRRIARRQYYTLGASTASCTWSSESCMAGHWSRYDNGKRPVPQYFFFPSFWPEVYRLQSKRIFKRKQVDSWLYSQLRDRYMCIYRCKDTTKTNTLAAGKIGKRWFDLIIGEKKIQKINKTWKIDVSADVKLLVPMGWDQIEQTGTSQTLDTSCRTLLV